MHFTTVRPSDGNNSDIINALKKEILFTDSVWETGLVKVFVAMELLLLCQQMRTCLILIDLQKL